MRSHSESSGFHRGGMLSEGDFTVQLSSHRELQTYAVTDQHDIAAATSRTAYGIA